MPDIELPQVLKDAPGMRAAELVIDGLAVFCFNIMTAEPFWEVVFPRQAQHDLKFLIQEFDVDGKPAGPEVPHDIDRRVERFTIRLSNGSVQHYNQFPKGGPAADDFDRNSANNDPHDLQWMVDLAGDELQHGNFLGIKPRHPSRPRSLANIRHSLLCNLEPEETSARISPRIANDPNGRDHFDLGPTNTFIVGVLLASNDGDILFDFEPGGLSAIDPHPYSATKRYRISIINHDVGDPPHVGGFARGDLGRTYDELIDVSGPEKDLWARPNPMRFSPDGDCHGTTLGVATLGP